MSRNFDGGSVQGYCHGEGWAQYSARFSRLMPNLHEASRDHQSWPNHWSRMASSTTDQRARHTANPDSQAVARIGRISVTFTNLTPTSLHRLRGGDCPSLKRGPRELAAPDCHWKEVCKAPPTSHNRQFVPPRSTDHESQRSSAIRTIVLVSLFIILMLLFVGWPIAPLPAVIGSSAAQSCRVVRDHLKHKLKHKREALVGR